MIVPGSLEPSLFQPRHLLQAEGLLDSHGECKVQLSRRALLTDSSRAQQLIARESQQRPESILGLRIVTQSDSVEDVALIKSLGPGAAAMGMSLEILSALGVREVLILGTAGSLATDLPLGEVCVISRAWIDEGVSRNYGCMSENIVANPAGAAKCADKLEPFRISQAEIWTTDTPFRETREKVNRFKNLGAKLVDMETSTALAVGRALQLDVQVVRLVSDQLTESGWRLGWQDESFRQRQDELHRSLMKGGWT